MWGQHKITSYCICVSCESGKLGERMSLRFPYVTPVVETSKERVAKHQRPRNVDCFLKKAPPQSSNWTLNADPTRGAVNVGCGWNASARNSSPQAGIQGSG